MPSLPKHSLWKFFSLHVLAGGERLFRSKPFRTTNDLRSIRNFLLLQYDTPLGSAVHATPVYEAIKHHIHGAHISVAASSLAASVLKNNPYVDDCMVTPDPWKDFVGAVRAVRHIYRNLPVGPVCIATTRGNQRSKAAFLAMLAGDAVRTGFTLATPMYDLPLTIHPERSQIEDNLDILRILGHNVSIPEPRLFFSNDDAEYAARWLSDAGLSTDNTRIIYVTKNSAAQRNQWRQERFEQVIRTLSKTLNAQPIFVGSAGEATDIDRLRHQLDQKGISLAGKTTIPQLAALMALCDIVVSLDTGTFHVARAVGLPGAVIAPAWQDPREWLPMSNPRYRVLRGRSIPIATANQFIDEISAAQVIAATEDLLTRYPPSQDARNVRLHNALCDNGHTVRLTWEP